MQISTRKLLKWSAVLCGVLLLLVVVAAGVVQVLLMRAPEYRTQLQREILQRTGIAVEIGELQAHWRLFGPEVVFSNVTLRDAGSNTELLTAGSGSVGFDIWTSLTSGRLTAGRFTLDAPQMAVQRNLEGRWEILGRAERPARDFDMEQLPVGRLQVTHAQISYRDLQTGGGPWQLKDIQLDVRRRPGRVRAQGSANLPAALGGPLTFSGAGKGSLREPDKFGWNVSINAQTVDLAQWAQVLPKQWAENRNLPRTGRGALQLGGSFIGAEVRSLSALADLSQVSVRVPVWATPLPHAAALANPDLDNDPDNDNDNDELPSTVATGHAEVLSYARVTGELQLERTKEGWHAAAHNLVLAASSERAQPIAADVTWSGDTANALKLAGHVQDLNIGNLWPLLVYLPDNERNATIRALQASGTVGNFKFEATRAAADQPLKFSANGEFTNVGFAPVKQTPGFTNLSGQFSATQDGGQLRLNGRDVHIDVPHLFRDRLQATQLQVGLNWAREAQGWRVRAPNVDVMTPDGGAKGSMDLLLPPAASPVMKMEFVGRDLNAVAAPRYMPAGRLNGKTLEWLDHAFKAGRVTEAKFHYDGPTRSFPFRNNEGLFLITAHIEGLTLHYQDGWMPATNVVTEAEFRNQGMSAQLRSGAVNGMAMEKINAAIADFKDAELIIDAHAAADMNNALTYVQASPVGPGLGDLFQSLRGSGKTAFDLKLSLPFKRLKEYALDVVAHIDNGMATTTSVTAQVTELSGILRVREHGLSTSDLKGKFLGAAVAIAIREGAVQSGGRRDTLVNAQGGAQAPEMVKAFNLPAALGFAGSMQWRMNARYSNVAGKSRQYYTLASDLRGLQVGLPEPFGKTAAAQRDLHVDAEMTDPDVMLVRASAADARALLRIAKQANGEWGFDRGGLQLDGAVAAMPDHQGLRVEGRLQTLVLDDWLHLKDPSGGAGAPSSGKSVSDFLKAANLRVGTFKLFGYSATDVRAVLQATRDGWRVDVASPQATGGVTVPYDLSGSQPIKGQFEHLVIGERETAADGKAEPIDPRSFPALQAHIDDFEFGNRHLGSVDAQLDRVPDGLKLSMFRAMGAAFNADATGSWLANATGQTTSIDLTLISTDAQQTLKALDYGNLLTAKHAELQAKLSWPGGIDDQFLGRASGTMRLDVRSGQLINIQPGAGRVLGLLSVAALPRRLALDFSDLTDKGFGFDTIHGDFELRTGNAFTSNLLLSGPAAEIGIAGRTGLAAHDYDQTAVVTGNLGSSLPAAGLLAGGPAVGAALLLFSQIFKEPLKGITRGYYRITGSWEKPTVERVDSSEVKDVAAKVDAEAAILPTP